MLLAQGIEEDRTGEAMAAVAAPSAEFGGEGNGGDFLRTKTAIRGVRGDSEEGRLEHDLTRLVGGEKLRPAVTASGALTQL